DAPPSRWRRTAIRCGAVLGLSTGAWLLGSVWSTASADPAPPPVLGGLLNSVTQPVTGLLDTVLSPVLGDPDEGQTDPAPADPAAPDPPAADPAAPDPPAADRATPDPGPAEAGPTTDPNGADQQPTGTAPEPPVDPSSAD